MNFGVTLPTLDSNINQQNETHHVAALMEGERGVRLSPFETAFSVPQAPEHVYFQGVFGL